MDEEKIKRLKRSLAVLKLGNKTTSSASGRPVVFEKTNGDVLEFLEDLTNIVSELAKEIREKKE